MIQVSLRAPVTRIITPLCRVLLRMGITANLMTVIGAIGTCASSALLIATGHLFAGSLVVTAFVLTDLFDGTMARLSATGGSSWGALLDSTMDRISDAAILGSVSFWLNKSDDRLIPVVAIAVISGQLVSYIKARAESLDIDCNGGLAERTERLILALISIGFAGLSVPYILAIGCWLLALVSIITVMQRLRIVYRATR